MEVPLFDRLIVVDSKWLLVLVEDLSFWYPNAKGELASLGTLIVMLMGPLE